MASGIGNFEYQIVTFSEPPSTHPLKLEQTCAKRNIRSSRSVRWRHFYDSTTWLSKSLHTYRRCPCVGCTRTGIFGIRVRLQEGRARWRFELMLLQVQVEAECGKIATPRIAMPHIATPQTWAMGRCLKDYHDTTIINASG